MCWSGDHFVVNLIAGLMLKVTSGFGVVYSVMLFDRPVVLSFNLSRTLAR